MTSSTSERYPLTAASPGSRLRLGADGGFRMTVVAFTVISIAVTVALVINIIYGAPQVSPEAAVASDHASCSRIGADIMRSGGSAVDAAIAAVFCLVVVHPHNIGLAGGGYMVVYHHSTNESVAFDFREKAPSSVDPNTNVTIDGASVGVPGLLRGLQLAHSRFGRLAWSQLVQPSVTLAQTGVPVSPSLAAALQSSPFLNGRVPSTGMSVFLRDNKPLKPTETLYQSELALTLSTIEREGADALYTGSLSTPLLAALNHAGSHVTASDLANYTALEHDALSVTLGEDRVLTAPAPSGGPQLLLQLLLSEAVGLAATNLAEQRWYRKLVDLMRLSSLQQARLGDLSSEPRVFARTAKMLSAANIHQLASLIVGSDGHGDTPVVFDGPPAVITPAGSHVAAVDFREMYVSLVGGLGSNLFGAGIRTPAGIMLNNAMAAFTTGTSGDPRYSTFNTPQPGRRPLSSYAPVIVLPSQPCAERVTTGGAEAQLVGQLLLQLFLGGYDLSTAVEAPRLTAHPHSLGVEEERDKPVSARISASLEDEGYLVHQSAPPYISCNAVIKYKDTVLSHADSRGGGTAYRI